MESILERMYRSSMKFLLPLATEELYGLIVKEAIKLVNARYGSLILDDRQGNLARVFSTLPHSTDIPIRKKGFTHESFTKKKAFVIHAKETNTFHPDVIKMGIKSNIYIPLSSRGKSMGVLVVNSSHDQKFTIKELNILKLFGTTASMAIRKNELYEEIRQALDSRDLFVSMAAHELRTPMTTILGYVQLLHTKLPKNDSNESRWVYELRRESIRLSELVNELLEVSRIRSGHFSFNYKEQDLKIIIEKAMGNFPFTHPDRTVNFEDNCTLGECIVIGDFDKLIQVITNLVDNAIKFSPSDSEVIVKLMADANYFKIRVVDQGKGIADKDKKQIFEGFYRASNNQIEGMGLGLFLVKNIVEKHHGSITVHSKVNKGTTFEVKLPRARK